MRGSEFEAVTPTMSRSRRSAKTTTKLIDSIRAVEVEEYKRSRLVYHKAAKESVEKEIRRLKAAFNRGVKWKELDVNPLASVKGPRGVRSVAVKFYDREAMRRLYRANRHVLRHGCSWLTLGYAGEK